MAGLVERIHGLIGHDAILPVFCPTSQMTGV
jgi:hypothetical protein